MVCHSERSNVVAKSKNLVLILFTVCAMFLSLTACGDDDSSFSPRSDEDSSVEMSSSIVMSSGRAAKMSSSSVTLVTPCKTETEDNCEYGVLVDERDGHTYRTVKIGDQVWMAENLNYQAWRGGCYNDSVEYCDKYGRLYGWYYTKTVCPEGWHAPSKEEWETLIAATDVIHYGSILPKMTGRKLKATSGWGENGDGTDAYGFSALPAGCWTYRVDFDSEGESTCFWSSTERDSYDAYLASLKSNEIFEFGFGHVETGCSIRCLKDQYKEEM